MAKKHVNAINNRESTNFTEIHTQYPFSTCPTVLQAENVATEDEESYKVLRLDFDSRNNATIKLPQQLLQDRANGMITECTITN